MFQRWECLTFLHWRYDPEELRPLLPAGLELDLFDRSGWIGITPFRVANFHPPGLPPAPWISAFPETNVRTYVRGPDGEPGIWFFTLEAARLPAVVGARVLYGLPYRWAAMSVDSDANAVEYGSRRHGPWKPAGSRILTRIGGPIQTGELESFLTARYRLYSLLRGTLAFADVEHEPWPLRSAQAMVQQDLIEGSGLSKAKGKPLVHYSPGVDVRIGGPKKCS
jgi:uncharacterized protein YqjF (DUF2071 family)